MDIDRRAEPEVELSAILPCFDEEGSLPGLLLELVTALQRASERWEIVCVDDASADGTAAVIRQFASRWPQVRLLRHARRCGQSAALASGFRAARGAVLLTLDADGQNDPADLLRLLEAVRAGADAACGVRVARRDSWLRRASSRIGNGFRDVVTGVRVRDAGCAARALRRPCLAEMPVFNGLHRFLPTLLRLQGWRVVELEIGHRPRTAGRSKYGIGNRALRGLIDCVAMRWFARRLPPGQRLLPEPPDDASRPSAAASRPQQAVQAGHS